MAIKRLVKFQYTKDNTYHIVKSITDTKVECICPVYYNILGKLGRDKTKTLDKCKIVDAEDIYKEKMCLSCIANAYKQNLITIKLK